MTKTLAALTAAFLLLTIAACSSNNEPAASTSQSTTIASTTPTAAPTTTASEIDGHNVLSAVNVLQAFQAAGLPVRNERYNDEACDTQQLGCMELLTTDDISIYTWADEAAQANFATTYGDAAYSSGNVVLSYLAQRTPAKLRPKYQAVLDKLK
ncbi:hypothetical protein [Kribbella sp. NPDC051718]|uniref:hypothetical protein n=1 Tax=Kribbella sp. NPDC051718 TaxID=3155168 RepID=UPI0034280857